MPRVRLVGGLALAAGGLAVAIVGGSWAAGRTGLVGAIVAAGGALALPRRSPPSSGVALGALGLDLLALALVVSWTGGLESPLGTLLPLHAVAVAFLARPFVAVANAALLLASVTGVILLTGQWPTEGDPGRLSEWVLAVTAAVALGVMLHLRRQNEERLPGEREEFGLAALETAAEGILIIDERGAIQYANPATEVIFGFTQADLLGRNVSMLMDEPDRSRHDQYLRHYLETGQARIIGIGREVQGRRRDGSPFPIDLAVSEVATTGGRRFMGIVRDITARKQTETRLLELNEQLRAQQEQMVQQEKMVAMGRMAAGIAHEIANPLASMNSLLQLMERSPERAAENAPAQLRAQVDRIDRIVREMMDFAHPNDALRAAVPLNDLVQGVLELMRFDHRLREVEVAANFEAGNTDVRVMPNAVQQIVVNFIANALDAVADRSDARIDISTRRDGDRILATVTDNGPGVPDDIREKIFDPFFTTKPVGRGTGLGLSISYSLAERHGGGIDLSSTSSDGTAMTLWLPAASAGAHASARPDS